MNIENIDTSLEYSIARKMYLRFVHYCMNEGYYLDTPRSSIDIPIVSLAYAKACKECPYLVQRRDIRIGVWVYHGELLLGYWDKINGLNSSVHMFAMVNKGFYTEHSNMLGVILLGSGRVNRKIKLFPVNEQHWSFLPERRIANRLVGTSTTQT